MQKSDRTGSAHQADWPCVIRGQGASCVKNVICTVYSGPESKHLMLQTSEAMAIDTEEQMQAASAEIQEEIAGPSKSAAVQVILAQMH